MPGSLRKKHRQECLCYWALFPYNERLYETYGDFDSRRGDRAGDRGGGAADYRGERRGHRLGRGVGAGGRGAARGRDDARRGGGVGAQEPLRAEGANDDAGGGRATVHQRGAEEGARPVREPSAGEEYPVRAVEVQGRGPGGGAGEYGGPLFGI